MCLCLWEQDSSRRGGLGADNQLAFGEGGPEITVCPADSSSTCAQPSAAEAERRVIENRNIRQGGG